MSVTGALRGAIQLAMQARTAVELARRAAPPLSQEHQSGDIDPLLLLRHLEQVAGEIEALGNEAKLAS